MKKVPIKPKLFYPDTRATKSSQASATYTTKPATGGRRPSKTRKSRMDVVNSLDTIDTIPTRPEKFKKRDGLFTVGTVKRGH